MEEHVKDKESAYRFFALHPVFRASIANKKIFSELIERIIFLRCLKSEYLYRYGERSSHIYLVQDGEIHILQEAQDSLEKKLVGIQRHGSLFGEVSFLSGEVHTSNAVAFLDSSLFAIPGDFFMKLLDTEPGIASRMAQLLSKRLRQNLSREIEEEKPAKLFVLSYPELPERGSQLSVRLSEALIGETSGSVLLMAMSKYSVFDDTNCKVTLSGLLESQIETVAKQLQNTLHPRGFGVIIGREIHNPEQNLDLMARRLPALLGHLRKYYNRILVDAGQDIINPVLSVLLSQSVNIVLVRNANASTNSIETQKWRQVVSYATDFIGNFFERVIILSDNCTARGGNAARPVNNYSALYKSHFYLHTATALALTENEERQFTSGLHRVARKLSDTSRGLALAGGGARALAHIGALDVLQSENIDFDGVAGTSMGALIAASYAMGERPGKHETTHL